MDVLLLFCKGTHFFINGKINCQLICDRAKIYCITFEQEFPGIDQKLFINNLVEREYP